MRLPEIHVLKYRRRPDGGVSRLLVGDRRRRVLNVLLEHADAVSVQDIARVSQTSPGTVYGLLQTLERAGWAWTARGGSTTWDKLIGKWGLTSKGREAVDNFVLQYTTSCWPS